LNIDKSATRETGKVKAMQRSKNKLLLARLLFKNPALRKERINTAEAERRESLKKTIEGGNVPIIPSDQGISIPVGRPIEGNSTALEVLIMPREEKKEFS